MPEPCTCRTYMTDGGPVTAGVYGCPLHGEQAISDLINPPDRRTHVAMPETPDFDQIARLWIAGTFTAKSRQELQDTLVEQLRHVWNARGAADLDAQVTALRAALEQAVKTCSACHGVGHFYNDITPEALGAEAIALDLSYQTDAKQAAEQAARYFSQPRVEPPLARIYEQLDCPQCAPWRALLSTPTVDHA